MRRTGLSLPWPFARQPAAPADREVFPRINASASALPSRRRIVVLSVSAGNGHVRAAQALCALAGEVRADMVHLDVMQFVPRAFAGLYTRLYMTLVSRFPALWSLLYRHANRAPADSLFHRLRRQIEWACTARLRRELERLAPDAIICTHFLPAELLSRLPAGKVSKGGLWVQVTDYDVHSMWIQPDVTGYFVGSEETAWQLRQRGVPSHRVHVTGIPVMPEFRFAPSRDSAVRQLGLDPARHVILLMGGGNGQGRLLQRALALLALAQQPTVIVATGRNALLLQTLEAMRPQHGGRLVPVGFTRRVEVLMACADVVVSKPGGLTTAECLALGVPMIVIDSIPGQEERNADYLLEHGAAMRADDTSRLAWRAGQLLGSAPRLEQMRAAARALGRPRAAEQAMKIVLASVSQTT